MLHLLSLRIHCLGPTLQLIGWEHSQKKTSYWSDTAFNFDTATHWMHCMVLRIPHETSISPSSSAFSVSPYPRGSVAPGSLRCTDAPAIDGLRYWSTKEPYSSCFIYSNLSERKALSVFGLAVEIVAIEKRSLGHRYQTVLITITRLPYFVTTVILLPYSNTNTALGYSIPLATVILLPYTVSPYRIEGESARCSVVVHRSSVSTSMAIRPPATDLDRRDRWSRAVEPIDNRMDTVSWSAKLPPNTKQHDKSSQDVIYERKIMIMTFEQRVREITIG